MFQLLQPIWLYAMAGIAIPLIIHLWDVRGGKKRLVGSISLIDESARQQGRSLRFTDILLLILRCLLIILLALVLARPVWKKQLSSSEKGWLMIEQGSVREAYKNFRPSIDSLLKNGYTFHYFNKGFPQESFEEALKKTDTAELHQTSYWSLLRQLNEQVPAELPVHLYSDNQLKRIQGARPEISMALTWHTFMSVDTITNVSAYAFSTQADSIRIIRANSNGSETYYTAENIPRIGNSQFKLVNNKIQVFENTNSKPGINLDTTSLRIAIYTDRFGSDAHYVKAALEAIQQYTQRKMQISFVSNASEINGSLDWLFWISDKPVIPRENTSNLFVYEKGKEQILRSWILPANEAGIDEESIKLARRIQIPASVQNNSETIWKDGFGNALLTREGAKFNTYHYYSRFNPDWNDLPWSPLFPGMLFDLIIKDDAVANRVFDQRMIDARQLEPRIAKEKKAFDKAKFVHRTDLDKIFWLAAFVIFCIERYLSLKHTKRKPYA